MNLLALLIPASLAHVPHDAVTALAPAPGLDPARPWWLLADHDEVTDLYRSIDGGRTWLATAGDCTEDDLSAAVTLDDGAVVLLGLDRVWWNASPGSTAVDAWLPVPLPFAVLAIAGGSELFLAAEDGVWTLASDGSAARVWAGARITNRNGGFGGVVATLASGNLAYVREGVWTEIPAPSGVLSATMAGAWRATA